MTSPHDKSSGSSLGSCRHVLSLDGYESSMLESRFAALKRQAHNRRRESSRWGLELGSLRAAGGCFSCGQSRLSRGHELMACLHCDFVGCWKAQTENGLFGRHIQLHMVREAHWLSAHVDTLQVYCARCGDFVFDPRLTPIVSTQGQEISSSEKPPKKQHNQTSCPIIPQENSVGCGGWLTTCLKKEGIPTLTPVAAKESRQIVRAKHGLRGIINMGNTCFLSSVVQVLAHLAPMQSYFLYGYAKQTAEQKHDTKAHLKSSMTDQDFFCLGCEMSNVFAAIFAEDNCEALIPHRLLYATWRYADSFAGYEQQDAHEFLMVLLDALAKHTAIDTTNIVNEIFRGELGSHLECQKCGYKKHSIEPFHDLSLALRASGYDQAQVSLTSPQSSEEKSVPPLSADEYRLEPQRHDSSRSNHNGILGDLKNSAPFKNNASPDPDQQPPSKKHKPASESQLSLRRTQQKSLQLSDLLSRFTCAEELSDGYVCDHCHVSTKRKKRLSIAKLPNVLVIHLKRFDAVRSTKITDSVDFPTELDLSAYIADHHGNPIHHDQKHIYHLAGVVNHIGDLNRGHYSCFFNEGGRWYMCNDTIIEEVSVDTVTQSEGYILFYVRADFATLLNPIENQDEKCTEQQEQNSEKHKSILNGATSLPVGRADSPAFSSTSNSSHPPRANNNNLGATDGVIESGAAAS